MQKIFLRFIYDRSGGGNTTPNDTETSLVATIRLEEFNDNVATCSKFCGHKNINASHLVILGLICQCFSGLKTFHCEEEEGEPLVNVYCIESKPEPVTEPVKSEIVEPVLSWRKPLEPLPKSSIYEMESLKEIEIFETTLSVASNATQTDTNDDGDIFTASSTSAIEKPAILVGVLLIAAVLLLVGFAIKTCVDLKRQKNNEINKRLQLSNETFTSVAFS